MTLGIALRSPNTLTMARLVHILAAAPGLRAGLRAELGGLPGVALEEHDSAAQLSSGDIVIAPVSECSPHRCAELVASGACVIVLAALPTEAERQRYWTTGANAYVPMTPGSTELADAVLAAAEEPARASG